MKSNIFDQIGMFAPRIFGPDLIERAFAYLKCTICNVHCKRYWKVNVMTLQDDGEIYTRKWRFCMICAFTKNNAIEKAQELFLQ